MTNFWTGRPAIITGLAITLLSFIYILTSPISAPLVMSKSGSTSSHGVPGLDIRLSQTSRNPPVLAVTVKNNSPDKPYTILKWGTPMDSAALNTGVFTITKDGGEELEQVVLQINRKMPPGDEEVVTIAPGSQEEIEVVFDRPWMPDTKPAKYKVKAEGEFKGVWDRYGKDVKEDDLSAKASCA